MIFADAKKKTKCASKPEAEIHVCAMFSQRKEKLSHNNKIQLSPDSPVQMYHFADSHCRDQPQEY